MATQLEDQLANLSRRQMELIDRLQEDKKALLVAAKKAEKFYVDELEAIGGYDHSVNICCCGIVSELEDLRDAIKKAESKHHG